MTRVDFDELTKRQLVMVVGVVLVLIILQVLFIRHIRAARSQVAELSRDGLVMERIFNNKADAVSMYKSSYNIDAASVPDGVESATRFYAILINLLANTGFEDAAVSKAAEAKESVAFKVSGEAPYFALLDLLATFRQSRYMMRLLNLDITGKTDGYVGYAFTVECRIMSSAPPKKDSK